jgi:outer membrane protein assembly factor BamB
MFDSLQGLDPNVYFTPGREGYVLFATDTDTGRPAWQKRIPVRVNAMAATADLLFAAGSPDVVDPDDPLGAFEGRKGGVIYACNKTGGETLWQHELQSPPVFNGLAAANGRLYLAMKDGNVACFGDRSQGRIEPHEDAYVKLKVKH